MAVSPATNGAATDHQRNAVQKDASATARTLTPELYHVRNAYKRATSTVLEWMRANAVENIPGKGKKKKTRALLPEKNITVKQIAQAAESISKRKVTLPQHVREAFKRALVSRRRITDWYRGNEISNGDDEKVTEQHDQFNNMLAQAYEALFPDDAASAKKEEDKTATETKPGNRFEILTNLIEKDPEVGPMDSSGEILRLPEREESDPTEGLNIADDPLEGVLALHMYVLEMDSTCSAVKGYWRLAASGAIPIPVAAWLTNAGFRYFQNIAHAYSPLIGGHTGLLQSYLLKKSGLMIAGKDVNKEEKERSGYDPVYRGFSDGLGLVTTAQGLRTFKGERLNDEGFIKKLERQNPANFFKPPEEEQKMQEQLEKLTMETISDPSLPELPKDEQEKVQELTHQRQKADLEACEVILRSITQISQNVDKNPPAIRKDMNPLLAETKRYFQSQDPVADTDLVVGLQVLLETCKSFVWKDDQVNKTNCRLKVLQFAQEVKAAIEVVNRLEKSAKTNTPEMYNGLIRVSGWLDAILKEPRFDLYYQAPWIAGTQFMDILNVATEMGLGLCNQRGSVGTVLHVYNVYRQMGAKSRGVPALEALCDLLGPSVFLNNIRPKNNFQTIYLRFLGGKLNETTQRNAARFLTMPKQKRDSSDRMQVRVKSDELSMFHELIASGFLGTAPFWMRTLTTGKERKPTRAQTAAIEKRLRAAPFAEALDKMKDAVLPEFYATFPAGKVNFFAVFGLCIEVLVEIARRYQEHMPWEMERFHDTGLVQDGNVDAAAGFGYVGLLMIDVDDRMKNKQMSESLADHGGLKLVQDAIESVCQDKRPEDLLWKSL